MNIYLAIATVDMCVWDDLLCAKISSLSICTPLLCTFLAFLILVNDYRGRSVALDVFV